MASISISKSTSNLGIGHHQNSRHAPGYVPPHLRTSTASLPNVSISGGGVALWDVVPPTKPTSPSPPKKENGGDLSPSPAIRTPPTPSLSPAARPKLDEDAFLKYIRTHNTKSRQALTPNVTNTKKLTENNPAGQRPKDNVSQQSIPQGQLNDDSHPFVKQDPHSVPKPLNGATSHHNIVKYEMLPVKGEFSWPSDLEIVGSVAAPADVSKWQLSPNPVPLTQGSLATGSGHEPHHELSLSDTFEDRVSDTGVDNCTKEVVRANQGRTPREEFLDWNGTWISPPVDWEYERPSFDGSFIPAYIHEWTSKSPSDIVLEMTPGVKEEFIKGHILVSNGVLIANKAFDEYPSTYHNPEDVENYEKRMFQTAQTDLVNFRHRVERRRKQKQQQAKIDAAHYHELASREPEPNPFAPKIDIYIRPATEKDARGIAEVYNYYVNNSDIPEDQVSVAEEDIRQLIRISEYEKLPFIVAIRGHVPSQKNAPKDFSGRVTKFILPQFESVAGFALAESRNYGFAGKRTGRNRFTVNLQLYVHHQLLGKGVGRCLLDCLLQTLSGIHGGFDGYEWINPKNDPVYNSGGVSFKRQLLFEFPTYENDPNYPKVKAFMWKFFFREEARLTHIGRASCADGRGPAKFLDSVIFSREATLKEEFGPFI